MNTQLILKYLSDLRMVWDYIVQNGEELESIIKEPEFQKYFTVQGSHSKMSQQDMIKNIHRQNI